MTRDDKIRYEVHDPSGLIVGVLLTVTSARVTRRGDWIVTATDNAGRWWGRASTVTEARLDLLARRLGFRPPPYLVRRVTHYVHGRWSVTLPDTGEAIPFRHWVNAMCFIEFELSPSSTDHS